MAGIDFEREPDMITQTTEEYKIKITEDDLHRPVYEFVKRILDVFLSSLALVVLSPLFLVTAIAVKTDGGLR